MTGLPIERCETGWPRHVVLGVAGMFALAMTGFVAAAHATVFGPDDRGPLPGHYRRLASQVGVIVETRSKIACTAFCVGERAIATAAHCLFRTKGEPAPLLENFIVRIGTGARRRTARIASAAGTGGSVEAGSREISTRPPIDATADWALVRLDRPTCTQGFLRISQSKPDEIVEAAREGKVFQVAYHSDRGTWDLAFQGGCEVARQFEGADAEALERDFSSSHALLLHKCDTGGGASGSPLLIDAAGGPEVAAINVGSYEQSRVIMTNGEVVHRFRSDTVANTAVATFVLQDRLTAFAHEVSVASRQQGRAPDARSATPRPVTGVGK